MNPRRKAVIVKGNPYYLNGPDKPHYENFYNQIQQYLEANGYDVATDPGEPYTSPQEADLWVGHSRGNDRLRFAPPTTRAVSLDEFEDPSDYMQQITEMMQQRGVEHVADIPVEERPVPPPEHYTFNDAMRAALLEEKSAGYEDFFTKQASVLAHIAGPSGSGKTTIGKRLASLYPGTQFKDLDDMDNEAEELLGYSTIRKNDYTDEMLAALAAKRQELLDAFIAKQETPPVLVGHHLEGNHVLKIPTENRFRLDVDAATAARRGYDRSQTEDPKYRRLLEDLPDDERAAHEDIEFLTQNGYVPKSHEDIEAWVGEQLQPKQAAVIEDPMLEKQPSISNKLTGPSAIAHALGKIDIDALEEEQKEVVRSKRVTKRPRAVAVLNTIEGLRRNSLKPSDLMVKAVPVIPPVFRPFRVVGSTFVPGDANELYQDLMRYRDTYKESVGELGYEGSADARLALYDSAKALFGYGDSPNPKIQKRGVAGFLTAITGSNPKVSWTNSKMVAKPVDTVSRGTVTVNPDLSMDEIGVPEELAWKMYGPFIQRHMVRHMGISGAQAVKNMKERNKEARYALDRVVEKRPVVYSRAPAWHKFNTMAGKVKITDGSSIQVNPYITGAQGMDFDGDAINLHVPVGQEAVDEAHDVLMPSKMIWSPRQFDTALHAPKHESILSLYNAQVRPAKAKHQFASESEALKAIETGKVKLSDEIEIAGQSSVPTV